MTVEMYWTCRNTAQRLWLNGWYLLNDQAVCLRECNGVGADWMPAWIRTLLSWMLRIFAPAVAIHDMRYFLGEGDRHQWDEEFEMNCRKLARDAFGKYNPLRYLAYSVAHRLRIILTVCGELAWNNAKEKRT